MPKFNVRRKAQLGLDIREGGIAIPIAPNMYYMKGRSHDNGGIAIGPNNKNGLEVEGGEVVKVGKNDVKVFSSVPLLRGVSPAQLVMGGANPNKVFNAQEEFKDRNRINDNGTTYETGGQKTININDMPSVFRGQKINGRYVQLGIPPATNKANKLDVNFKQRLSALNDDMKDFIMDGIKYGQQILPKSLRKYYAKGINILNSPGVHDISNAAQKITQVEAILDEKKVGGIYIKPSKRGTFTAAATKHGMGVQEFANKVLANKEDYSPAMVKKANFARNASRWKKRLGGEDDTKTAALKRLRNKFTIRGNYNGGLFGGAGAGSIIMKQPEFTTDTITKKYLVPVTQNFNDAFGDAVNAGLDKFMFDKKWYTTEKGNNPNNNAAGATRIQTVYLPVEHKEIRRREKEFGGNMIYTINGNIKNGLMSLRPKAQYGKKRKVDTYGNFIIVDDENYFLDKDNVFVPVEKTIIKKQPKTVRGASNRRDIAYDRQGNRYQRRSDGSLIRVSPEKGNIATNTNLPELVVTANKIDKENINNETTINSKIYKSKGNKQYVYDEYGNRFYRRSDGTLLKAGKVQSQSLPELIVTPSAPTKKENKVISKTKSKVDEPKSYTISGKTENYLTGQRRTDNRHPIPDYIDKRPETVNKKESVKASTNSTPRKGNTQTKSVSVVDNGPKVTRSPHAYTNYKGETKIAASPYNNVGILKNITGDSTYDVSQLGSPKYKAAKAKLNTSSTGGGTQAKDGRWVGQYKATNAGDWIGLGSNVLGSLASYFITKNAIDKMPDPVKPIMAQATKLKTRYNIEPQLTNVREAEQMNRASVRRNTVSSNTSLAREQRLVNESRGTRNQLYGQKENIETQLINQDRLNRQSVRMDNVRTYNDYLNRLIATRQSRNQLGISNINNLIYGLTGSVNNIIGNIESRKATNNTLRAIAAANPNVDARLIGGFDYYIDPITKKKYNKNQQYVGTING